MTAPKAHFETRIYGTFRMWIPAGAYSIVEMEMLLEKMKTERVRTRAALAQAMVEVKIVEGERV